MQLSDMVELKPRQMGKSAVLGAPYGKHVEPMHADIMYKWALPSDFKEKLEGTFVGTCWDGVNIHTNPCAEIMLPKNNSLSVCPDGWYRDLKKKEPKMSNTPHSERNADQGLRSDNTINVSSGRDLTGILKINDEDMTLTVTMPGVEEKRLQVRRIDNLLRIRVMPKEGEEFDVYKNKVNNKELTLVMTAEEEITDVTLALGILTVSINRGREIEDLTVHV